MGKPKQSQPLWTDRDSALWHTCELAADLAQGRPSRHGLRVLTPFRPQLAEDEQVWVEGRFELLDRVALGDGSYVHNGGFFFATGPAGLAATAAVAVGTALGNNSRRRVAQARAVPRWMPIDAGLFYVSAHGFYMHSADGLFAWPWNSVAAGSMVGPGALHLAGDAVRGPVSWILRSDWAELVFVTWALAVHPEHPQLVTGDWLPPGWLMWAAGHHPTRLATPGISARG
jgi:hypothetical protein